MRSAGLLRSASLVLLLTASGAALCACNLITGADGLVLDDNAQGGRGGGDGGSAGRGGTPTTGDAGSAGIGGAGGTPETTSMQTTTPTMDPVMEASGVTINQIALYQGVKKVLMQDGQPGSDTTPIAAGREALVRLFVTVDGNYNGQPVTARFSIQGQPEPIEVSGTVNGSPSDSSLGSTINLKIPGASIQPGFSFNVVLLQPTEQSKGPNPGARYPAGEGFATTDTKSVGPSLKIVLVPIQYGADGSNRLPDTSPQMLQGYKDLFYAMYPAPDIDLTVRDPVPYNNNVSNNGNGWDQLLNYIGQVREQDNAPFEAYYYGIFSPASSVATFCGGGCVAGLGNIGPVNDAYSRHAIGLGFGGQGADIAWETAVHEIGHTHGRYHSPCGGAAGPDPGYPYPGAKIGTWGYHMITQQLYNPQSYTDVMGYCQPIWVSDYTFKAFFNRIKGVNNANLYVPEELMNLKYDRARVDGEGKLHWESSMTLRVPPQANELVDLTVQTAGGVRTVKGHYYPYDHLPGGTLVWPQVEGPASAVALTLDGVSMSLAR